jgi:cytoskeleton protein RodZ
MTIGIGDALRSAREEQGRTIEEAALHTRVRGDYLRALEDERFDVLGGDVYAKGFLSTYARFLGLDPQPLLDEFRRSAAHDDISPSALVTAGSAARPPRRSPPSWLGSVLVGIIVLVGAIALLSAIGNRAPAPVADGPADPVATGTSTPSPTPTEAEPTEEPSTPTEEPTVEGVDLFLAFEQDCWIRVEIDGQQIEESTVPSGETRSYKGDERVTIRFGNPGGVLVELNGEDLGPAGDRGVPNTVTFTQRGAREA